MEPFDRMRGLGAGLKSQRPFITARVAVGLLQHAGDGQQKASEGFTPPSWRKGNSHLQLLFDSQVLGFKGLNRDVVSVGF